MIFNGDNTAKILFCIGTTTVKRIAWGTLDGERPTIDDHLIDMRQIHGEPDRILIEITPGKPVVPETEVKQLKVH